MEQQAHDVILKMIDFILQENVKQMDEMKHLTNLTELGVPLPEDMELRMAIMQGKLEVFANILNIVSPAYGGIKIVLPPNLKLFDNQNSTDEQK